MPQWGHTPLREASASRAPGRDASDDAVKAQEDLWI